MATVDPVKRERAEAAYHALFSRVIETPGLDINQEFNYGTPPSVNELLDAGGFGAKDRGRLVSFLTEANRAGLDTQKGELRNADFRWNTVERELSEIKADQLLSPNRLQSFEQTVKVMDDLALSKRPERLADAQRGFSEALSNGFKSDEQTHADAEKVRLALLDAGIDNDRASEVYHGLEDGLTALKFVQLYDRGDGAKTAQAELNQSMEMLSKLGSPVMTAQNLEALREVQTRLDKGLSFEPGTLRADPNSSVMVRTNQDINPEQAAKDAPTRLAQMEAITGWYEGKHKVHSLSGFYDVPFKQLPGAIDDVKRYMDPNNPDPDKDIRLAEAVQNSEKVLGTFTSEFRQKSPQELVKVIDDMREGMFNRADMVADAFGELPVVGPIGRGIIKETAIGLRYASGDITGKEALFSGFKEAASSTVDAATGAGKIRYAGKGAEFADAFSTTFATEAVGELGKAWAKADKDPSLDRSALASQAIKNAAIKGLMDAGGKFLIGQGELESPTAQGMKDLVLSVAKKFGVDRELEAELARRSEQKVSALSPNSDFAPNERSRQVQDKVAALSLPQINSPDQVEKVSNRLQINAARDGVAEINYVLASRDAKTVFGTTQDPMTSRIPVLRTSADVATALTEDVSTSRAEVARVQQSSNAVQPDQAQTQTTARSMG